MYNYDRQVFQMKIQSYKHCNRQSRVRLYHGVADTPDAAVKKSENIFVCFNISPFKVSHQKSGLFLQSRGISQGSLGKQNQWDIEVDIDI